jgi:hypothetical protein
MTTISLEIVNFEQEMRRIEQEVLALANQEIGEKIDYATKQLRIVTPVDTGKAREGWQSKKLKEIDGSDGGLITNEVEYIDVLNKGHSKQAPSYFIEQVLSKIGILTPN